MSASGQQPVSQLDLLRQIMELQRHVKAAKVNAEQQAAEALKAQILAQAAAIGAHIRREEEKAAAAMREEILENIAAIGHQIEGMRLAAQETLDAARQRVMLLQLMRLRDELKKAYALLRLNPNVILP